MNKLHLKIVTPEKEIFDGEVDEVLVTTEQGEIGILPNHENLMSKIVAGELRYKDGNQTKVMVTGSGLLQVVNNTLSVLTDLVENESEIDVKAAEEARNRAQAALEQTLSDEEYAETIAILEKSLAKIRVKRRHHT